MLGAQEKSKGVEGGTRRKIGVQGVLGYAVVLPWLTKLNWST